MRNKKTAIIIGLQIVFIAALAVSFGGIFKMHNDTSGISAVNHAPPYPALNATAATAEALIKDPATIVPTQATVPGAERVVSTSDGNVYLFFTTVPAALASSPNQEVHEIGGVPTTVIRISQADLARLTAVEGEKAFPTAYDDAEKTAKVLGALSSGPLSGMRNNLTWLQSELLVHKASPASLNQALPSMHNNILVNSVVQIEPINGKSAYIALVRAGDQYLPVIVGLLPKDFDQQTAIAIVPFAADLPAVIAVNLPATAEQMLLSLPAISPQAIAWRPIIQAISPSTPIIDVTELQFVPKEEALDKLISQVELDNVVNAIAPVLGNNTDSGAWSQPVIANRRLSERSIILVPNTFVMVNLDAYGKHAYFINVALENGTTATVFATRTPGAYPEIPFIYTQNTENVDLGIAVLSQLPESMPQLVAQSSKLGVEDAAAAWMRNANFLKMLGLTEAPLTVELANRALEKHLQAPEVEPVKAFPAEFDKEVGALLTKLNAVNKGTARLANVNEGLAAENGAILPSVIEVERLAGKSIYMAVVRKENNEGQPILLIPSAPEGYNSYALVPQEKLNRSLMLAFAAEGESVSDIAKTIIESWQSVPSFNKLFEGLTPAAIISNANEQLGIAMKASQVPITTPNVEAYLTYARERVNMEPQDEFERQALQEAALMPLYEADLENALFGTSEMRGFISNELAASIRDNRETHELLAEIGDVNFLGFMEGTGTVLIEPLSPELEQAAETLRQMVIQDIQAHPAEIEDEFYSLAFTEILSTAGVTPATAGVVPAAGVKAFPQEAALGISSLIQTASAGLPVAIKQHADNANLNLQAFDTALEEAALTVAPEQVPAKLTESLNALGNARQNLTGLGQSMPEAIKTKALPAVAATHELAEQAIAFGRSLLENATAVKTTEAIEVIANIKTPVTVAYGPGLFEDQVVSMSFGTHKKTCNFNQVEEADFANDGVALVYYTGDINNVLANQAIAKNQAKIVFVKIDDQAAQQFSNAGMVCPIPHMNIAGIYTALYVKAGYRNPVVKSMIDSTLSLIMGMPVDIDTLLSNPEAAAAFIIKTIEPLYRNYTGDVGELQRRLYLALIAA